MFERQDARDSKYDDSGHCPFAQSHHFIAIVDDDHKIGICCAYCSYLLYEHMGNEYVVTPAGELIEII